MFRDKVTTFWKLTKLGNTSAALSSVPHLLLQPDTLQLLPSDSFCCAYIRRAFGKPLYVVRTPRKSFNKIMHKMQHAVRFLQKRKKEKKRNIKTSICSFTVSIWKDIFKQWKYRFTVSVIYTARSPFHDRNSVWRVLNGGLKGDILLNITFCCSTSCCGPNIALYPQSIFSMRSSFHFIILTNISV